MSNSSVNKTAGKLFVAAFAMFGFGYLLVPLYDVFCEVTGLNGKTGQVSQAEAIAGTIDETRLVSIQFDTNIRALPWEFKALDNKVSVHPGALGEARFVVKNNSTRPIVGRAVPSVAPTQASVFFNKTECFCFDEQRLEAGESREIVVRFVVGTGLPERFGSLVLSYTFFEVKDPKQENGLADFNTEKAAGNNI